MRYMDTASRDPQSFMGCWLADRLTADIRSFEAQYGYFEYVGLAPFAPVLRQAALNGAQIHFVIGANRCDLTDTDLRSLLKLFDGTSSISLTVVSFANGLFHPKVTLIEKAAAEFVCLVGSGNLTLSGISRNVEAFLALDTNEDNCSEIMSQLREAIAYWRSDPLPEGAFRVRNDKDIQYLLVRKIICTQQERDENERFAREQASSDLPSLKKGWEVPKNRFSVDRRLSNAMSEQYGRLLMRAFVELSDGQYQIDLYQGKTNRKAAAWCLQTGLEVKPYMPFLRRIIREKGLDVDLSRERVEGLRGQRTLTKAVIEALSSIS